MDAGGGRSERLTWDGMLMTHVAGWRPDGSAVIYRTNARQPFLGAQHLCEVSPRGGPSREIPVGLAREITFQPGGPGIALGVNTGDPARWKRYRGGTAGRIWVDRNGDGKFGPLVELDGNLSSPMWIGKRIYFISDHEGHGNLYSCTPTGRGLARHTDHQDHYARFSSTDGKRIVYHAGGDIYLHDVAADHTEKIAVEMRSARSGRNRRYVSAAEYLESAALHPQGHSLCAVTRGGAYTMGLWDGAPYRHGEISSTRVRLARWLPDGERIVAVDDEPGEEQVVVRRADGTKRPLRLQDDHGRALDLAVAPVGDKVALSNHRQELWLVDLAGGESRRVAVSGDDRIAGLAWSPDGRWLAYGLPVSEFATQIRIFDTERGEDHEVTRPEFGDFCPAFDPGGKYLYFLSRRVFDPVYDEQYFDLGFPRAVLPCLVTLAADEPSPFSAATRSPRRPQGVATGEKEKKSRKKKEVPATKIDFEGIADRVVAFPVAEGRYVRIAGALGRAFFSSLPVEGSLGVDWRAAGPPPAKACLQVHRFADEKTETFLEAVTDFSLSSNGRALLARVGNRLRALSALADPSELSKKSEVGRETGWIDIERIRVAVDPGAEWRQMFDEAWRLQRDHFWDPEMSRVDWKAVHAHYAPLVDRVSTRAEFSDLLWELQGELGTSHNYEMGGDYLPTPHWPQGMLGADVAWHPKRKRWVVERIPRGDSWIEGARSPLALPGVDVAVGDAILAVDGQKLSAERPPDMCLVNQAGREVVLTMQRDGGARRQVTVKALASEMSLRYRDWVEANRERVHKATRGKVGYVHVPNMGPVGFSEFHRYYKQELDHPGLIVDVRYNGGGHVSQLLLQKLARKRIGYGYSRWMGAEPYPSAAPMGPMVALTNEFAGSDGDIFSHSFKLLGLGPLIGKRTWGGVVGIWPRHALVDGTVTTQAEFATWFHDVDWGVENYGTDPDIEVDIRPQDWAAGKDPQLDRALKEIRQLIRERKPALPRFARKPRRTRPKLPPRG
jgi:tricorn protease